MFIIFLAAKVDYAYWDISGIMAFSSIFLLKKIGILVSYEMTHNTGSSVQEINAMINPGVL